MFQTLPAGSTARLAPSKLLILLLVHLIIALTVCATNTTRTPISNSKITTTTTRHPNHGITNSPTARHETQETVRTSKSTSNLVVHTKNTTATMKATNNGKDDHQAAASLLRPSFFRGLLKPHRLRNTGAEQEAEEEEEVTQTIMVPVNPDDSREHPLVQRGQVIAGKSRRLKPSEHGEARAHSKLRARGVQPSAEASLRLTSTEIGGLLNDREAPEFYRERELGGEGVMLGEEFPGRAAAAAAATSLASTDSGRLGMAASGQFGSQFMGGGGGEYGPTGSVFDSAGDNAAAFYRHRLAQAASEDAYGGGGSGFNHRFGQQAFAAGGGGLMQSPNEYSEVNNYGVGGSSGFMGAQQHQHYSGDFSPHSGLLRAGSEGAYGGGGGGGGLGMMGGSAGLDGAAALAGGGEFNGQGGSEFGQNGFYGSGAGGGGGGSGRLQAHASFNPYMQSAAGEAEYASRFGQHHGGGRAELGLSGSTGFGFASQNQFVSQHLQGAASDGSDHGKLMPFTPVVPLADELAGVTQPSVLSSNQREMTHSAGSHTMHQSSSAGMMQPTRAVNQQVHEALEDDPTDVSAADESGGDASEHQQRQQALQQHYEGGGGGGGDDPQEGVLATTMSSNQQDQFVRQTGGEHSLVLNVPPPPDEQQQQHMGSSIRGRTPMVEFSRVGSAGYLGPNPIPNKNNRERNNHMMLSKKSGYHHHPRQIDNLADQSDEDGGQSTSSSSSSADESSEVDTPTAGADNPAHAGKYIID